MGLDEEVCPSYMPGVPTCLGGVMALDGGSGAVLWQHWTHRSVLFVDCSTDLNGDKTNDCVISGKGGVLSALSGLDGSVLWELKKPPSKDDVDVYAVQYINDVDFDLVPDILAAHSSIVAGEAQGHLVVLSGRTGRVVSQASTPGYLPVYSHPQVMVRPDGTDVLLFTTGSTESAGGLYAVPLHHLVIGNMSQSVQLTRGGVNEAPVLVDINRDGSEDIIIISDSQVTAIDGVTLEQIWNVSAQSLQISTPFNYKSQILNSPTPAYFNDDDIPDFLFTHVVGSSYPEFYYSLTSVVDGRTGQPLMDKPMVASAFVDVPGISLSVAGRGNDLFLYWSGVCEGYENNDQRFSFLNSTPIRQRVKADLCRLRFNASLDLRLYAFSEHTAPPGLLIYSSEKRWKEDHNTTAAPVDQQTTSGLPILKQQPTPLQPTQQLNNFHHTGDSVEHLKASPHHHSHNGYHRQQFGSSDELPVNLNQAMEEYERLRERRPQMEWHPQESDYSTNRRYQNLGMYGGVLPDTLGVGDLEAGYGPEGDDGPVFPPNVMGRDERAEENRPRRSIHTSRLLPHVGSPGTLAPALAGSGVDLVVTTHWLPSADVYVRLPRDEQCILERMSRITPEKYDDLEALRATVEEECLLARGVSRSLQPAHVSLAGQLTVSRVTLDCVCDKVAPPGEECAHLLSYERQSCPQRGPNTYYKPHSFSRPVLA
ncbi:uncharacterized protein LOC129001555 isoform X2 [Macrosteles quadrilineatus]|nr:uncharacterized protein LOC129001555 isoform X2 [Macrosteles quadrilineatus]